MVRSRSHAWQYRLLVALLPFVAACGSHQKQAVNVTPTPPERPAAAAAPLAIDPVLILIAESDGHFQSGERELQQGHFDAAKLEFDRAVNLLLAI